MAGLTNLQLTLQSVDVTCNDIKYGFASTQEELIELDKVLATFHEDGRLAVIAASDYLHSLGIVSEGPYAQLTINAHTSLELVGLTAVIATTLAKQGISANVVAAFYHDHVFVPYALREKAIQILNSLKDQRSAI